MDDSAKLASPTSSMLKDASTSSHLNVLSYLDGLKVIPGVHCARKSRGLSAYIDMIKEATVGGTSVVAKKLDHAAHGELSLYQTLLRYGTPYIHLRQLTLSLLIPKNITRPAYGRTGRLQHLGRLRSLTDLHITTEGLFGSTRNLAQLFGGPQFVPLDNSDNPNGFVEAQTLEDILSELPKSLKRLVVQEWYHQYIDPQKLLPIQRRSENDTTTHGEVPDNIASREDGHGSCLLRAKDLQRAILLACGRLARALKETTSVEDFQFNAFQWKSKDAQNIAKNWMTSLKEVNPGLAELAGLAERSGGVRRERSFHIGFTNRDYLDKIYEDLGLAFTATYFPMSEETKKKIQEKELDEKGLPEVPEALNPRSGKPLLICAKEQRDLQAWTDLQEHEHARGEQQEIEIKPDWYSRSHLIYHRAEQAITEINKQLAWKLPTGPDKLKALARVFRAEKERDKIIRKWIKLGKDLGHNHNEDPDQPPSLIEGRSGLLVMVDRYYESWVNGL
ncbi:hypothetical protein B0T16DRAFT_392731 [Cercophora newfieldiana]|uniref:Uncharacterized protein n=1 Tax=Cercophora newfieldiana TaxID=92897 RepID=A0AA39Y1P4_9PEZI|nr:hypothetical protein B0T16DRAFT_392731 [Cercophora newfieldiana]